MATVVLDTSVLIALFKTEDPHHKSAVKATSARNDYLISAVTLSEALVSAFRISEQLGEKHQQVISKWIHRVIAIDEEIAMRGAQIRAERNLTLPEALISATAQKMKAQLWSCDRALIKAHSGAIKI